MIGDDEDIRHKADNILRYLGENPGLGLPDSVAAKQAITAELERCAAIASDACLEQDEAGHARNSDTWLAACAWIRMRITGESPKLGISPADLIRESERERCLKHAVEYKYDGYNDDDAASDIAELIRSGK